MTFLSRLARQRAEELEMETYGDADEEYHLGDEASRTLEEARARKRGFPIVGGSTGTMDHTDPAKIDWDARGKPVEPLAGKLSPQVHHPDSPRGVHWKDPGSCPVDGARRVRLYSRNQIVCPACGLTWTDRRQEMP